MNSVSRSNPSRASARRRSAAKTKAPDSTGTAISGLRGADEIARATLFTRRAMSAAEYSIRSRRFALMNRREWLSLRLAGFREANVEVARFRRRTRESRDERALSTGLQARDADVESPMIDFVLGLVGEHNTDHRHGKLAIPGVHHFAADGENRLAVLELLLIGDIADRDPAGAYGQSQRRINRGRLRPHIGDVLPELNAGPAEGNGQEHERSPPHRLHKSRAPQRPAPTLGPFSRCLRGWCVGSRER